jgi:PIN domain nuclease of toxin-antitoxin system
LRIIVDTHIYLWALADPERIAPGKRNELESLANTVYVSSISIAEIMIKASLGKLEFSFDPISCTEEMGFQPLNFSAADAILLRDLPFHHRDPFDRMLIAQSIAQKAKIMSDDRNFTLYDCDLL